jgi:hypothetical protein
MIGIPITPLGHLGHALYPLPVVAVLLWFIGRRTSPSAEWNTRVDLGLAAVSAIVVAGMCVGWMPRYFMLIAPLTASDFSQYCESVGAFRGDSLDAWVHQRSLVAGALPGMLSKHLGIVDGLFVSAVASIAALGAGVFLWARAAHSRVAGLMAALVTCAIAPLVLLSRTATFYPEAVATYVCCAAGVMLALRYRTLPAIVAGAVGIGCVLLIDVRGLIWALPALGLVGVAALAARGWVRRIGGILVIGLVLWGSHSVGARTTWETTPSLELQATYYVDEALRRASPNDPEAGIPNKDVGFPVRFIWGRSPISDIPETLSFLWALNQLLPEDIGDLPETRYARRVHVMPYVWTGLFSLGLVLLGLRRRPLLMLGFVGSLVPFAIALQSASTAVVHARYIATGIAMAPVILGVGFAVLYSGALTRRDERRMQPLLGSGDLLAIGVGVLLILGVIPSWLSPAATWRAPISADAEPANAIWHSSQAVVPSDVSSRCASALRKDYAAGYPVGSRLLGWTVAQAPKHRPR